MNRFKASIRKTVGITVLSFGAGVFMTFFLPDQLMIVIESVIIIGAGVFYLLKH